MKAFFLKLLPTDFTNVPTDDAGDPWPSGTWVYRTNVIDLYDNSSYRNYATRKAPYGNDLTGQGIYTGNHEIAIGQTEVGELDTGDTDESGNPRFIDTTSRIDISRWRIENLQPIQPDIYTYLTIRLSPDNSIIASATPSVGDYVEYTAAQGDEFLIVEADRYAQFELRFESHPDLNTGLLDFEVYVLVEIQSPIIDAYFRETLSLLDKFPEWMAIRELENTSSATPVTATPLTIGGKLLNAVAGEWLTDIRSKLRAERFQHYINTIDLSMKDWAFVVDNVPTVWTKILGNNIQLAQCSNIEEFYSTTSTDDIFYWDRFSNRIFLTHEYDSLIIVGMSTPTDVSNMQRPYHMWNALDDIGVGVDLFRIRQELEDNASFQKRILDVYRNRPGVGIEAFKYALRRELNLWKYQSTPTLPDSDYGGATPTILEIEDIEKDPRYFGANGVPTQAFKDLVETLARKYPTLWGYLKYDRALWDPDGLERLGYGIIDRILDATPMQETYLDRGKSVNAIESGVGDLNDLYMFKPDEYISPIEFEITLEASGRQRSTVQEYSELEFDVLVYGQGDIEVFDNPSVEYAFTIEPVINGVTYYCNVLASAVSDIGLTSATPTTNSLAFIDWVTADGRTNILYEFRRKSDNELVASGATPTTYQLNLEDMTSVTVVAGHYDFNTSSYINIPTQANYRVWFDSHPGTILGYSGDPNVISIVGSFPTITGNFYFESRVSNSLGVLADSWKSGVHKYSIKLNGQLPDHTTKNYTLTLPNIVWHPSTTNREIIIELDTSDGVDYGAYTTDAASKKIFLDSTYLDTDLSSSWIDGRYISIPPNSTTITFSSVDGDNYPIQASKWSDYTAVIGPITGTVDANGPWRDGEPSIYGSNNNILTFVNVGRSDFGIPETDDYIISSIRISHISEQNVIAWLDTTAVKPYITDADEPGFNLAYLTKYIEEYYDEDNNKIMFSSFPIRVKAVPTVSVQWNPKVHSGWFYDDVDEYYLYADRAVDSSTSATLTLSSDNNQSAPILASADFYGATPLRQVGFWEVSGATPSFTLFNTELLNGTGTNQLFTAYPNIYDITVYNKTLGTSVSVNSSTTSNIITASNVFEEDHEYEVKYKVVKSYYYNPFTREVVFDKAPADYGYSKYWVHYENSKYDPSATINVPLNPLYTDFTEGFIYIDHDQYDLGRIELKVNPSKILASDYDYLLVNIETYDIHGNPKPDVDLTLYTNFGEILDNDVRTDRDGRATVVLHSKEWTDATPFASPATPALWQPTPNTVNQGVIHAELENDPSNFVQARFDIHKKKPVQNTIIAVVESDSILSNGITSNRIFGRVLDSDKKPIANEYVYWRKARNIYELFNEVEWSDNAATPGHGLSGRIQTDSDGRFNIGPFNSHEEPGYWFVSVETGSGLDLIGDIVYWYEYPDITISIDPTTNLAPEPVQHSTPTWLIPPYRNGTQYPVNYDEEEFIEGEAATPPTNWLPPRWYAISKYIQYHMGLNGVSGYYVEHIYGDGSNSATPPQPDYREY